MLRVSARAKRPKDIGTCNIEGELNGPLLIFASSKILRDNIQGVTKGDIRRLARRGGVKRISTTVYPEMRLALRSHLEKVCNMHCLVLTARL